MPESLISLFTRLFHVGKRDKSPDTSGHEEIASSTADISKRIGNQGMNDHFMGEAQTKPAAANAGKETGNAGKEAGNATEALPTQDAGSRQASIGELYKKLKDTKRGGFHLHSGNSSFYNKVMDSMHDILDIMKQGFSTDTLDNLKQFDHIQAQYQKLINECEVYLNRTALTDKGRIRQKTVKNILQTAQKDLIGISGAGIEFASLPPQEQAGRTWAEVVDRARITQLSVDDLFGIGKEKGGAASEVIPLLAGKVKIREKGATEDETEDETEDGAEAGIKGSLSKTYYFKPEDEIEVEKKTYASKIVNSVIARYPKLTPKEQKSLRTWAEKATEADGKTFPKDPKGLSNLGILALETIKRKTPEIKNTYDNLMAPSGIAGEGGKANMTRRNVATSRMAALLGVEHLVAKSYTAEVRDKATGQRVKGNMMEQVEGLSTYDHRANRIKEYGLKNTPSAIGNLVQRDLLNLQILDVLCGQTDRHMDNIMVQVKGDTITGITGIDNDGAFGLNTDVVAGKTAGRHDRRIFDPMTGEMLLPYMDKNLAQRILALEPDTVRFFLKGLITDREIEAAVQRLSMMKQGIQKADKARFLEDNQWNRETAQTTFEQGWDVYNRLNQEKKEEVFAEMGRIEPRLKGVKRSGNLSAEMKERFLEVREQAEKRVEERFLQKKLGMDNYFGKLMITTMGDMNAEKTPQIEIHNT